MTASKQHKQKKYFNYLASDAGQIHYWTAGSGPNLVLVHQSGNSSEEFAAVVPYLADHFRMIAVDLPGHGRSYNPSEQPNVEEYAAAVKHVLDALNIEKTHIAGHHGGALSTMSLLAAEPERFDKVILSGVDEEYLPEDKQALIDRIVSTDTSVRAESDFIANAWTRYQGMLSEGAEPSLALKPFMAFLDARLRPHRAILTNLSWDRKETIAKLSELHNPILIVKGERDSYVVKQERLLSMIPNSEYLELPGAGTFMFYDHAEQAASMILDYIQP